MWQSTPTGNNVNVSWTGGVAPYIVERSGALPPTSWRDIATPSGNSTNLPITNATGFFRVQGR
jgi:hypothetical protein